MIEYNEQVAMDKGTRARMNGYNENEITDGTVIAIVLVIGIVVGMIFGSAIHDKLLHPMEIHANQGKQ